MIYTCFVLWRIKISKCSSNTTKLVYVVKKDSPITPPQRRYLAALVEKHNINLEIPVEEMTKSMASRQIDTIIAQYGK